MQNKLSSIDQKIEDLKKKKKELQEKQTQSLAKMIARCGLEDFDKTTLAGALLDISSADQKQQEVWHKAGEKFLASKRSTRVKKAS